MSESYFERVKELRGEGMELGEAASKARGEMVFAGRITEEDVMPRIEAGEVLPGEIGTVAGVQIAEETSAVTAV